MIKQFIGDYAFLSNFALVKINHMGRVFTSVENAYAASKCKYDEDVDKFLNITSGQAKRLGRTVAIRDDWEDIKYNVMRDLVFQKFEQEPYKSKLLQTGDLEIQEGNYWKDTYWGVDLKAGIGKNNLGKILMEVRESIKGK